MSLDTRQFLRSTTLWSEDVNERVFAASVRISFEDWSWCVSFGGSDINATYVVGCVVLSRFFRWGIRRIDISDTSFDVAVAIAVVTVAEVEGVGGGVSVSGGWVRRKRQN